MICHISFPHKNTCISLEAAVGGSSVSKLFGYIIRGQLQLVVTSSSHMAGSRGRFDLHLSWKHGVVHSCFTLSHVSERVALKSHDCQDSWVEDSLQQDLHGGRLVA